MLTNELGLSATGCQCLETASPGIGECLFRDFLALEPQDVLIYPML